mmetsp:Transcript_32617/g.28872  ORF Transcript_32617/g.28872 Transcript_32617/m.28872 type:complete len:149 (+) Transcript_32617:1224-1670(+)
MGSISEIEFPLHTIIKITPQTYGYQEEIFSFDIETEEIKSYPSLNAKLLAGSEKKESHRDYITQSKQKLSFDTIDLKTPKRGFESMTGIFKKNFSHSDVADLYAMSRINNNEEVKAEDLTMTDRSKTKAVGLKRTPKYSFRGGKAMKQ